MKVVALVLLAFVVAAFAGYGDPSANPTVTTDTALLPTVQERALHAAYNFMRSDPAWWRLNNPTFLQNTANGIDFLGGVSGVPMLPYDRRIAGAAHYHAGKMVQYSPTTCANTGFWYNETTCSPDKTTLNQICCFRQQDCDNCTRGPDYRIIDFGYVWNKTATAGGGWGDAIAANTPPELIAQAIAGIVCDPPDLGAPDVCSPKDSSNLNRAAVFGIQGHTFFGGGGGYAGGGKEEHYWVFDAAFGPNNDNSFKTAQSPIASASFVGFNASFGGWMVNWDDSAGSPAAGLSPQDVMVVVSGVGAKHLGKLGTKQNYFIQDSAPSSCVAFAFGAKTTKGNYRYPQGGNVQWGCATDYAADTAACGTCDNGICFQGTCYTFSATTPPKSSAASVVVSIFAIAIVVLALML